MRVQNGLKNAKLARWPGSVAWLLVSIMAVIVAACAPTTPAAPTLAVAPSAVPSPSAAATTAPAAMVAASPSAGATAAHSPKAYVGIFNDNVVAGVRNP